MIWDMERGKDKNMVDRPVERLFNRVVSIILK